MVRTDALIRAQKKYYENNKEKIAKMKEKWKEKNPDYGKEKSREYYKKNREKVLQNYRDKKKIKINNEDRIMTITRFDSPKNVFGDS